MNPLEDEARIVIFERKNALAAQNVRPFFLHQVLNPGKELVGIERLFGVERNRLHLLIVIVLEPAMRMRVDVVMVMMIPTTAILQSDSRTIIQRAAHRLIGCLLGALAGLAALAFVGSDFLLWIVLIPPGIWLCSQIQTGTTGLSYIGTQAMFAYLMSMVQGLGPPDTISPGFERLIGVMGGLSVLFVVTLILSLIPLSRPMPAPFAGN